MSWNGWHLPTYIELLMVAMLGLVMLGGAMISFAKAE
jgi:hypothetical protein